MTPKNLQYTNEILSFSVEHEGQEFRIQIDELWMKQEIDYPPAPDLMLTSVEGLMKKAFNECWTKIEKHIARRIENKQFGANHTIFIKGN